MKKCKEEKWQVRQRGYHQKLLQEIAQNPPKLKITYTVLSDVPGPRYIGTGMEPPAIKPRRGETALRYWNGILAETQKDEMKIC